MGGVECQHKAVAQDGVRACHNAVIEAQVEAQVDT